MGLPKPQRPRSQATESSLATGHKAVEESSRGKQQMATEEHTQVTCHQIMNAANKWQQYSLVPSGSRDSFLWKQAHLVTYPTIFLIAPSSQEPRETSRSSLPPPPIRA